MFRALEALASIMSAAAAEAMSRCSDSQSAAAAVLRLVPPLEAE
jgi:hypothetical protein